MEKGENKEKDQLIVGVSALITNSANEILIIARSLTDSMPGVWETPGGGLDMGEDPHDAVIREVKEEVGLDVEIKNVLDVIPDANEKNNIKRFLLQIFYAADLVNSNQTVTLSPEHSDYRWVKPEELKDVNTSPLLKNLLKKLMPI